MEVEKLYFFEHIESGKWINYDTAKLTTNYKNAFFLKNKEWAEQWIKPITKNEKELERLGFAPLFMDGLKKELDKKGINLYGDFTIVEHTIDSIKQRKIGSIVVEFNDGKKISIVKMDGDIFHKIQNKYKLAIVKIDGVPSHIWGMTEAEIETELKRIVMKKNDRDEAIKKHQANCKHDKGYVTNTGMSASKCVICGKPMY